MGKLAGKVAMVSGSGRGIGREVALKLAREGARVVVNAIQRPITSQANSWSALVASASDAVRVCCRGEHGLARQASVLQGPERIALTGGQGVQAIAAVGLSGDYHEGERQAALAGEPAAAAVAGDQQVGPAAHAEDQELLVVGVAAAGQRVILDRVGFAVGNETGVTVQQRPVLSRRDRTADRRRRAAVRQDRGGR
jgi:NAD(P)-dependent dehydrogenase (short-subunit alcohol dehydrogenase family)